VTCDAPPPASEPRQAVLIATDQRQECERIQTWAAGRGLEVMVEAILDADPFPLKALRPLLQVVEWRRGVARPEIAAALHKTHSRLTLLILSEGMEPDLEDFEIEHEWDFVRRPYSFAEFVWRASRALSRLGPALRALPRQVKLGPLRYDRDAQELELDGAVLPLRRAERDLLLYLMQNANRFITCRELQQNVLRSHGDGGAARNQVYELRRKLRSAGLPDAILTAAQRGYRLCWSG